MIQEKLCTASSSIPDILRSKFTKRKSCMPIILVGADKMSQHLFQGANRLFNLPIRLRLVCGGHALLDSKQSADLTEKCGFKK